MSLAAWHRRLSRGEENGAAEHVAGALLGALSVAYRGAVALRNAAYDCGLLPVHRAPVPVLVVGSLSTGGTGKTPCAAALAVRLTRLGHRPLLVGSGYGARTAGGVPRIVSGVDAVPRFDWTRVGEEAVLLARLAPGIPVAVARRRETALDLLRAEGGAATVLVLDGGFQHRRLRSDVALVALDASRPPRVGRLLPWGDMREPWASLRRADGIVLHRWELCSDPDAWETWVARFAPNAVRVWSQNTWGDLRTLQGQVRPWQGLHAARLGLWTGLANPEALLTALERQGIRPIHPILERDHAPFDAGDADRLRSIAHAEHLEAFLVTAKDAVKLEAWADELPLVLVLNVSFEFVSGVESLERLLLARLGDVAQSHVQDAARGGT